MFDELSVFDWFFSPEFELFPPELAIAPTTITTIAQNHHFFNIGLLTLHPQSGHITAFLSISFPHLLHIILIPPLLSQIGIFRIIPLWDNKVKRCF